MTLNNHTHRGEHRSDSPHPATLENVAWWGEPSGFDRHRTQVRGIEWMGAVALIRGSEEDASPVTAKQAAAEVCMALDKALEGTTDKVFLATLKQLLTAGEITLMGFIIRLSNLYPDEMEALDFQLKERIKTLTGTL